MQPVESQYGQLRFHKIYKGQTSRDPVTRRVSGVNGSLGELDTGAWVHFPKGLPITDPEEARDILGSISDEALEKFNAWWDGEQRRRREVAAAPVVRPIKIVPCTEAPGSKLVFDDDTDEDVTQAGDVVAFYRTGELQGFALKIFGARYQMDKQEKIREATETPRAKMEREIRAKREAKGRKARESFADAVTVALEGEDNE